MNNKDERSEEEIAPSYETVVGRSKKDTRDFGTEATGYIGKHIVGSGEDAHLTTHVFLDLLRPHIILITGKRGTGKSYDAGVIAEEMALLPEEYRKNLAMVFIDTMGIFWSMKNANAQQAQLLREWRMQPRGLENVKVYVPYKQIEEFESAKIAVDGGLTIAPSEFSAEEWRLAFNLSATDAIGISIEKNVNELSASGQPFTIQDLIAKINDDRESSEETKSALENMLTVADQWGVFGTEGVKIDDVVAPGQITVIDVSHFRATEAWSVRNFIVAIIARKIYNRRLIARKDEELAEISGEKLDPSKRFPVVWLMIDEAHNFCPSDFETVSSAPIRTISKQGREPGVSLVVMTQMPNKMHQDILSQCDIVFAHRLTSKDDLQALHSVSQAYHEKDIWHYINLLPRQSGTAAIIDDNLEKIFLVQIRPRFTWHAGGTAVAL
jgi:hypothetical protein